MRDRRLVAAEVADKLFRAELAIDAALVRAAELMGALPTARRKARLAATVGQPAFDGAAGAVAALASAREAIVATHEELACVHERLGLGSFASGPWHEKPPDEDLPNSPQLHVVLEDRVA